MMDGVAVVVVAIVVIIADAPAPASPRETPLLLCLPDT